MLHAWSQSLAKGVELCRRHGHQGDAATLLEIINDICGPENMPNQVDPRKTPYWEQKCPTCGSLGTNATRGIPQKVYCINGHSWTN